MNLTSKGDDSYKRKHEGNQSKSRALRIFNYRLKHCPRRVRIFVISFCIDFSNKKPTKQVKSILEFIGVVILGIYTCYTARMYTANRDAADGPISAKNVEVYRSEGRFPLDKASKLQYEPKPLIGYPETLGAHLSDGFGIYSKDPLSQAEVQEIFRRDDPILKPNQPTRMFSILIKYEGDLPGIHHSEICILTTLRRPSSQLIGGWWIPCPWKMELD